MLYRIRKWNILLYASLVFLVWSGGAIECCMPFLAIGLGYIICIDVLVGCVGIVLFLVWLNILWGFLFGNNVLAIFGYRRVSLVYC